MQHRIIKTPAAPTPKRHFSQGSRFDRLVFTSGQGPVDPKTGTITTHDIAAQTRQTFENLRAILEAGGSSLAHVLKVNVYLRRMEDIAKVDEVFRDYFPGEPPPRATIGAVLGTPGTPEKPGMDVEIEMIGYVPDDRK
jgi:2-iminobutanoate/2-iminopropanoate deaminase